LENVGNTITTLGSQRCYDRINSAFQSMEQTIASGEVTQLTQQFRLCADIDTTNDLDIASFKIGITMTIGVLVENSTPAQVAAMCESITNEAIVDDVEALANWMLNEYFGVIDCVGFSFDQINELYSDPAWDTTATIFGGIESKECAASDFNIK
jgi:hypothetical protein